MIKEPATLWNKKSPFNDEYLRLTNLLVPPQGRASTMHGNLLRHMANLYYDYYNNGLCNADSGMALSALGCINDFSDEIEAKLENKQDLEGFIFHVRAFWDSMRESEFDLQPSGRPIPLPLNFPELLERVSVAIIQVVAQTEQIERNIHDGPCTG